MKNNISLILLFIIALQFVDFGNAWSKGSKGGWTKGSSKGWSKGGCKSCGCSPSCINGGDCKWGSCDCTGTGYDGSYCQNRKKTIDNWLYLLKHAYTFSYNNPSPSPYTSPYTSTNASYNAGSNTCPFHMQLRL